MAQGPIIQVFMDMMGDYNELSNLLDEARRKDPEGMDRAVDRILAEEGRGRKEMAETGQPEDGGPEEEAGAERAQQRISILEDQLEEEKQRKQKAENQVNELQAQVEAYEKYLKQGEAQDTEPRKGESRDTEPEEGKNPETANSREETVMEAITQPGRFPNLRFLNNANKDLAGYGKPRPTGREITQALEAVEALAGRYLGSERGDIGSWRGHLNLPGWAYSNAESETTMGKYPKHRSFWDQEKNRQVVVQRHITYRGSGAGLQIFFDAGGEGEPFIVAYIGEHLPYVTSRS